MESRRTRDKPAPEAGNIFRSEQPRTTEAEDECSDQSPHGENQGGRLGFLDLLGAGFLAGIGGVSGIGGSDPSIDSDGKGEVSAMARPCVAEKGFFDASRNMYP